MMIKWLIIPVILFGVNSCIEAGEQRIIPAAERTDDYIDLLKGKRIAVMANQTSVIGNVHLIDTLLSLGINIEKIFSIEHGFRGTADRGSEISSYFDPQSGVEVISLYGSRKKPNPKDMEDIDLIIFDVQDVGVRFYSYISSLQRMMEACAENDLPLLLLDRPNPNGFYVDGPVLDTAYRSFVGLQSIPVVHGMTVGEYALMLNGEGLLSGAVTCDLIIIKCAGYTHNSYYSLPVRPSPNLPNQTAVLLYPSLCFFEGTPVSIGRGTDFPFQVIGHPDLPESGFSFTPRSVEGAANPVLKGIMCHGYDLRDVSGDGVLPADHLNLRWLIRIYNEFPDKDNFFTTYFNTLAGNKILQEQIKTGISEEEIRFSWLEELNRFKKIREKYLLYD